jgi:hypothetical protein
MKVFISWSGEDSISQQVANVLYNWLPMIIQSVEPWISTGISSGDRWNEAINTKLSETSMGIICVTKESLDAPWLNFEAGAIAKGISNNKVIPLLINLKPSDLSKSPLAQFQAKSIEKASIFELLCDINESSDKRVQKEILKTLFDHCWDDFYNKANIILTKAPIQKIKIEKVTRPSEEILEEVLSLTRDIRSELSYRISRLEQLVNIANNELSSEDMFNLKNILDKNNKNRNYIDGTNRYIMIDINKMDKIPNDIKRLLNEMKSIPDIVEYITTKYNIPSKTAEDFIKKYSSLEQKNA